MELYNLLRIGGRVICIARFRSSSAAQREADLHSAFRAVRFKQTKARRLFKLLFQAIYCYLVYYGLTNYDMSEEQADIALKGSIAVFVVLFHAEIKIGISRNTENRVEAINDDLQSGYTEWFHIPWPLAILIPIVSWFEVRPAQATVGLGVVCFIIFGLVKYM